MSIIELHVTWHAVVGGLAASASQAQNIHHDMYLPERLEDAKSAYTLDLVSSLRGHACMPVKSAIDSTECKPDFLHHH